MENNPLPQASADQTMVQPLGIVPPMLKGC
jgi:hypothetical protein